MSTNVQQDPTSNFELTDDASHFGVHFMLDGYQGDSARLDDAGLVLGLLNTLPEKLGMQMLGAPVLHDVPPVSEKDQGGKTGFVVVTESHISIHTFPQRGFVTADVYTCKSTMDTDVVSQTLVDAFGLRHTEVNTILRGRDFAKFAVPIVDSEQTE
jgi:S-adenosylmethionine decarboxylase